MFSGREVLVVVVVLLLLLQLHLLLLRIARCPPAQSVSLHLQHQPVRRERLLLVPPLYQRVPAQLLQQLIRVLCCLHVIHPR